MPLPQPVVVQFPSQPSPSVRLPSSQVSLGSSVPSPHSRRCPSASHVLEQPSPSMTFPSSHCSPTVTTPLPQAVTVQFESQPSPSTPFASSQASSVSMAPSPHAEPVVDWQSTLQPSSSSRLPSSHSSPAVTMPLPQANGSSVQVAEQPSFDWTLPSSHSSAPSSTPLPQTGRVQSALQLCSGSKSGSHSSPGSSTPSPHSGWRQEKASMKSSRPWWCSTSWPRGRISSPIPLFFRSACLIRPSRLCPTCVEFRYRPRRHDLRDRRCRLRPCHGP